MEGKKLVRVDSCRFANRQRQRGVSLIEVLIGILIVVIASIGTLTYFGYGLGGIGKQSNRRAALERARERLEQIMAVDVDTIKPPVDATQPLNNQPLRWVSCIGATCAWVTANPNQTVPVNNLATNQPIQATVQWKDDPSAGTTTTPDALELGVKVWFTPGSTVDDEFHRVHLRSLRTP